MSASVTAVLEVPVKPNLLDGRPGFPETTEIGLASAHDVERAVIGLPVTAAIRLDIGNAHLIGEQAAQVIADRLARFRAVEVVGRRPAGVLAVVQAIRAASDRIAT